MNELQNYSQDEIELLSTMNDELQAENEQLRTENQQLRNSLQLLTQLCNQSENETQQELLTQLNERDKQISMLKEQNELLTKKLNEQNIAIGADKERIAELEAEKNIYNSKKERILRREKSLSEQEKANDSKKAFIDEHIRAKAYEMVQDTISRNNRQCENEKARYMEKQKAIEAEQEEWKSAEEEKIRIQVEEHKATLNAERAEEKRQHEENECKRDAILKAKIVSIDSFSFSCWILCAVVTIASVGISLIHGLLPVLIKDGKEIVAWIVGNWSAIFGHTFVFPNSLSPILQLIMSLICLIFCIIWTIHDIKQANYISITVIGISVGISAVFGKQLSELAGINTIMLPIAVYMAHMIIRFGVMIVKIGIKSGFFEDVGEKIGDIRYRVKHFDARIFLAWAIPIGTIIIVCVLFETWL